MSKRALEWCQGLTIDDGHRERNQRRLAEDEAPDNPEPSRNMDESNEDRNDDPVLQSNPKIFLSHSGVQKDFVEQLCRDLERHHHFPFFDKRSSCLPKGERFPELILKAAQQCQMAVVVVSEDYFMSKWPMIELHAFVQTRLKSNVNLKILPLFYGLSVEEFGSGERQDRWFKKWEDLAKVDSRINVDEWKNSLKVLTSFNGIVFNHSTTHVQAFREEIVANICKEVLVDIKWNDSHVQGRSKLCKAIHDKIQQVQLSQKPKACSVGFYGVGGIGKTTMSKSLCNELYAKFKGKVSHIEFGSGSSKELLKKVLKDLTNTSEELLQKLSEGECQDIFRKNMKEQRIFLAIDNVWDDSKSIEEAKMYLQTDYHKGSVVMVMSRSFETLKHLNLNPSQCFEMPELDHDDATNLFLYHAAYGTQFSNTNENSAIEECVALCYFCKRDSEQPSHYHYLPLALKALDVQMGCVGNEPSLWKKSLPKMRNFNYLEEEQNPVFSILRSSFDRLRPIDQSLFMDVLVYNPMDMGKVKELMEWLSVVYKEDLEEIERRLLRLKERGLLEDVDMTKFDGCISVHDLYREFAKLEAEGKLDERADFEKRKWVYYKDSFPTELVMTPSHRCWQKLIRIGIEESRKVGQQNLVQSLQGIEWLNCSNVVVLKLDGLRSLEGDLNLHGLKCLRSLELIDIFKLDSLDGLQDLYHLTYFSWIQRQVLKNILDTRMGKLPSSLKFVDLRIPILLGSGAFTLCSHLSSLVLDECRVQHLDFSNCKHLRTVSLDRLKMLETLPRLTAASTPNLQSLEVLDCKDLLEIPGLGELVGLQSLGLQLNSRLRKLPDLQNLTKLQVLDMSNMGIVEAPGLGCLHQLHYLRIDSLQRLKLPSLSALKQLDDLQISNNDGLSSLEGVLLDLPALRSLVLTYCATLKQLPNLQGMTSLEELNVRGSGIEIGEDDLRMLATLPGLHPVWICGGYPGENIYRLDVVRRKVMKWVKESYQSEYSGWTWEGWTRWEESDLGMLPIKVRDIPRGPWVYMSRLSFNYLRKNPLPGGGFSHDID